MSIFEYDEERTRAEMREDYIEISRRENSLSLLAHLVKKGLLTLAQAAEEMDMTIDEFKTETGLKA